MEFSASFEDVNIGITKNYEDIHTINQIHSNKVVFLGESNEGDAIITDKSNVKIGIKTADCVPILVKSKNYVGAIHAGWRGLYQGIIKNVFELLRSLNETIEFAFIGPSAKDCCYEVGLEFNSYFKSLKTKDNKLFFDTQKEAMSQLKYLNPNISLFVYETCSICNKDIPSFRRDKTKERIISYIQKI